MAQDIRELHAVDENGSRGGSQFIGGRVFVKTRPPATSHGSSVSALNPPTIILYRLLDIRVLLTQPHQFQPQRIHQSHPTRLNDVFRYPDGSPASAMVAPFNQHSHLGGGAFLEVEHADFVIG